MSVLRRATSAAGTKAWKRRYPGIPPAQAAQQATTPNNTHGGLVAPMDMLIYLEAISLSPSVLVI